VESTTYDLGKRVLTVKNTEGASVVSSYQYTYDTNGNRKTQTEVNGGVAETTTYAYDSDDRLLQVAYPDKTTAYTYDPEYNRLTEKTTLTSGAADTDRTYAYNPRNQLTGITDNLSAANSVQYSYDANGNQTIKTKNGVTTTFVYDVRDELVTVLQNATTLGLFHYDYQGLRISKDMGGQVLRYTYDDNSVLLETDNTGATVAKFDYGAHHLLSLTHVTEGREFYLFDGLGSVADLTTLAGSIQARYQYDAFGNFRAQAGSSFNRFAFTGHEKDNETGLYYFKARYYDPEVGRFLSQDAYLGDVNTPPSLHKYLYAYANPAVYLDLTGYASLPIPPNTPICDAACERNKLPPEERQALDKADNAARQQELNTPRRNSYEVAREQAAEQRGSTAYQGTRAAEPTEAAAEGEEAAEIGLTEQRSASGARLVGELASKGADKAGEMIVEGAKIAAEACTPPPCGVGALEKGGLKAAEKLGEHLLERGLGRKSEEKVAEHALERQLEGQAAGAERKLEQQAATQAEKAETAETATLKPYGGKGGGHHVPAKKAFEEATGYDEKKALAIPNAELERLKVSHSLVSGAQQTGYRALAKSGAPLTWEAVSTVETNALIRGGMKPEVARATVTKAIDALKTAGVPGPTTIPWGGK
jgi:RHS repeat-associated protein